MALVKLTSCWNPIEAQVIKGALDTAGIACIVQGTNVANVEIGGFGIGNSAFEIPILVREEDLEDAKKAIINN